MSPRATDYIRGELRGHEVAQFAHHLDSCASCREEVTDLQEVISRLLEMDPKESCDFPDVCDPVLSRITEHPSGPLRSPVRRAGRVAVVAGSIAAIGLVAVALLWPHSPGELPGKSAAMLASSSAVAHHSRALLQARDWLLSVQEPNGNWDPERWTGSSEYRIAVTSLVTLALIQDDRPSARAAVLRAGEFLIKAQGEDGYLGRRFRSSLYNHAIGTLTLVELSGLHPSPRLLQSAAGAIDSLVQAQDSQGAWGYSTTLGPVENQSISIWALQALTRWRALRHPVDTRVLDMCFDWFEQGLKDDSRQRYLGRGGHVCGDVNSPIAPFAALLRRGQTTETVRAALDRLLKQAVPDDPSSLCCYQHYFLELTMHATEMPWLQPYRTRARSLLLNSQVRAGPERGSWGIEDRWSPVGGRLYTTALAALTLQSYPRLQDSSSTSS